MGRTGIFTLTVIALLSASCTMGEFINQDIVGGRSTFYNKNGRVYMMHIADNLVTDFLDELELALDINQRGASNSSHFEIGGPLTSVGTTWSVRAGDSALSGMSMTCSAENCWTMAYEGKYAFEEFNYYPTRVTVTARRLDGSVDPSLSPGANGWRVSIEGEREEREGYGCTFDTPSVAGERQYIDYVNTRGEGAKGWDCVLGALYMAVYKDGKIVDYCCLSFEGSPSQATFIRGL